MVKRHLGHVVLHRYKAWATVLIVIQDRRYRRAPRDGRYKPKLLPPGWEAPRYILTRWQKLAGLWRLRDRFRLTGSHVDALPEVQQMKERVQRFIADDTVHIFNHDSDRVAGLGGPLVSLGTLCAHRPQFPECSPVECTDNVCDEPFLDCDEQDHTDPQGDMEWSVIVPDGVYKR